MNEESICLHMNRLNSTCYASYERVAGYTIVELLNQLKYLSIVSCCVATLPEIVTLKTSSFNFYQLLTPDLT